MTLHHARRGRRCLFEVGWYSHAKIPGSVAGLASNHQIEWFGPVPVGRLFLAQHQFAWDLGLAVGVLMVDAVLGRNSLCQGVEVPEQQEQQVLSVQPGHAQPAVHPESVSMKVHSSQVEHSCTQRQNMRKDAKSAVSNLQQVKLGTAEGHMRSSTRWGCHSS
jgi:hypothetical protein